MKTTIPLHHRLTHQFNSGWAHEDRWAYIGEARQTRPVRVERDEDGGHVHRLLIVLSPAQLHQAKRVWRSTGAHKVRSFRHFLCHAMEAAFERSCQCEHDCCGHAFTTAWARRITAREYAVEIQTSYNR